MTSIFLNASIGALAARFLTSGFRRKTLHTIAEARRRLAGRPREILYFHQVSDPYSHLMLQVLPRFAERFGLTVKPFVISTIHPDMMPEPEMLRDYGLKDVSQLAMLYGLDFPENAQTCDNDVTFAAGGHLAQIAQSQPDQFFTEALRVGTDYWNGASENFGKPAVDWAHAGENRLEKLGHYLPGTVWYAGEWYWGIDRLDHLETRLIDAGLGTGPIEFDKTWKGVFEPNDGKSHNDQQPLELFFSVRSPYSYIGLFQARRFADAMGLDLHLRPVLPMVMRNMKVPLAKRVYIVTDAKREATKADLPFGNIADPLGAGIERTYAVAHWIWKDHPEKLEAYFRSAMKGIAAEGINVATNSGLRQITERVGLNWDQVQTALADPSWKDWVSHNRETMTKLGLWGVPCLRYGDVSAWGQDRFWLIRQEIVG